ncbi:gamma-glutamyltransferase [candidate division KSB1 bacterium]|nr:gamma-glutamyltransferase [candidate division KSB1 bacterium]
MPEVGDVFRNPDFAQTLTTMAAAEKEAQHRGRAAGIQAARDAFYKGPIAERIVEFITAEPLPDSSGSSHKGLLSYEDLAEWNATVESSVSLENRWVGGPQMPSLDPGAGVSPAVEHPGGFRPGKDGAQHR